MPADEAEEKASEDLEATGSVGRSGKARGFWTGERVAFIATVVAAVVAAFAAIYVSNDNSKAQASVAQSDFLHNQRQVAYAEFWTDFSSMYVALKEYMMWFESGNRGFIPTEADVKPSQAAYLAAAGKVSSDAGVVRLIGSNQVVKDMLALTGETDSLAYTGERDYTAMVKGFSEGSPFASLDDVFSDKHFDEQIAINEAGNTFLADARVDLGSDIQ